MAGQTSARPRASVVVTCYNYGRFLPAAVAGALEQPGVDMEVIIADNGSTDDSVAVAERLAAADSRIRILRRPHNIDYLENFNAGLALATGAYVQVLCADDLLAPGAISRAVAVMEARADVVFVYGTCPTFVSEPRRQPRTQVRGYTYSDGRDWVLRRYRHGDNIIRHPEVMMRTSVLREIGGYDPAFGYSSDLLLWIRAALRGTVARIEGPDQAYYRIHGSNLHLTQNAAGWLKDLTAKQEVFEAVPALDPDAGITAADVETARRALARRAVQYACREFSRTAPRSRELGARYADYARELSPAIERSARWRCIDRSRRTSGTATPLMWAAADGLRRRAGQLGRPEQLGGAGQRGRSEAISRERGR